MSKVRMVTVSKLRLDPENLWGTAMANFIDEQPMRFTLDEGKLIYTGVMYWFDTYLDACIYKQAKKGACILRDDSDYSQHWVVVVNEKPTFCGENHKVIKVKGGWKVVYKPKGKTK